LKFHQETGIRPEDWEGRYWARWGDALKEAGFKPNTLQPPYDEELAFSKLVSITRKLGHLPTLGWVLARVLRIGFTNRKRTPARRERTQDRGYSPQSTRSEAARRPACSEMLTR
jgi:hypothetical protein